MQVALDRQGFSPGEIDGQLGPNARRALAAFQQAKGQQSTAELDCELMKSLQPPEGTSPLTTYEVTDADLAGPFEPDIPRDLTRQAALARLPYRSVMEAIAERFHASPALLSRLNEGKPLTAGASIQVPNVQPFDPKTKPTVDPNSAVQRIEVSKDSSTLTAYGADGALAFFAPVSSGSEHDPLPIGQWKVTSVLWMPPFHYNPDLFWDARPDQTKATIKPGPNNPVGVVWIGLDAEHYGLHGTPEPSHVGHTESHGCVRMTNWDAARLAGLVKVGTPVVFK
ncbi:MAG TPA: L,D-transpeptidase family protein [Vicinamibacterales bacterium]|nr:L,D-transpeptidase family protein [Vicinamibacterales bacterium]